MQSSTVQPAIDHRDAGDSSIAVEIINPDELLQHSRQGDLHNLNNLINHTYEKNGHPVNGQGHGNLFVGKRITSPDQLVHELSSQGVVAICTDSSIPDTAPSSAVSEPYYAGKYGKIVAVGALKPWKGKTIELYMRAQQAPGGISASLDDLEMLKAAALVAKADREEYASTWNWEVTFCSTVADAKYRGKGLIVRCCDALVAELRRRRGLMRAAGDPRADLPIKLWSTTLEGSGNTEYWLKRGFVKEGDADVAPRGTWTATRDFMIQTLSKVLD